MSAEPDRDENQAAYRRLKPVIDRTYPHGWFVAIDGGRIIADAATFEELSAALAALGKDSPHVLVAEAGEDMHPESGVIFACRRERGVPVLPAAIVQRV